MKKNLISIVVPCYNEEEAIPLYYEAMTKQMQKMDYVDFEIIFVNDGSKDKSLEINNDKTIPNKITTSTTPVETKLPTTPLNFPTKNIVAIVINKGNLPLHGTKQFVTIAIILSLVDLIIRHPITPAALHPNPMHIVKACFPHVPAFLKKLSKLNAILGNTPKSSNKVKRGKNIAIGGSITLIIHVTV